MNSVDIQLLSAYMDSELTPFEKENVEQRLSDDAAFWSLLQKLRQQDLCLRDAVGEIEKAPLPAALENLLNIPANDDTAPQKTEQAVSQPPKKRVALFSALRVPMAAAVMLATALLLIGRTVYKGPDETPAFVRDAPVQIHISQALSSIVAGTTLHFEHGLITEILAFVRKDGALCKHYVEKNKGNLYEAVACYEEGNWINPVATTSIEPYLAGDEYAPAGLEGSPVDTYIQEVIDGTSLTIEQERALMDQKLK